MRATKSRSLFLVAICIATVTGCPRFAHIDAYNNTGHSIEIIESGDVYLASDGDRVTFRFGGDSFLIRSELGLWTYERRMPHSDGARDYFGDYYDGTLRLQIEGDGLAYALRVNQQPPVAIPPPQPAGYPLSPRGQMIQDSSHKPD